MKKLVSGLVVLASLVSFIGFSTSANATIPYPTIHAAVGDSITRGFNVNSSCLLRDCPQYAWSNGTNTGVNSHYLRLRALSATTTSALNYAKTGAKVADLKAQLQSALKGKAQYVTVLIGANDACTSSPTTMTSTAAFRSSFESALSSYFTSPNAGNVFVASIPNIKGLYDVFKNNSTAKSTWRLYKICQSMLGSTRTDAERQTVLDRVIAFNQVMAEVCGIYPKCKFDGNQTFGTVFTSSDISTIDYFHPSAAGQKKLSEVTWSSSFWGP